MQYPNEVQAALLFDGRVNVIDEAVRTFLRVHEAKTGVRFNVPESKPGVYYRLFGAGELMVTLECLDHPANPEVFQQALASTVTGLLCPDMRERVTKSRSHVLINVSHGVLGGVESDPKIAAFFRSIGRRPEGATLPQFEERLATLALLSRIVCDHAPAYFVHWTQSNQLIPGELFDAYAADPAPSRLHIHPYLFGQAAGPDGKPRIGIRTFGVRHFIGHEVLVEPNPLPWAANLDTILALIRVATIENGYIIPDGDTFGPDDGRMSYRVTHRPAGDGDVPLLELTPLMHRDFGFQAPDYVPRDRVFDDRLPPPALMPDDQEEKQALANEWREKRAMAEGVGGRFEVRARGDAPLPPPGPKPWPAVPRRGVFGRKGGA